MNYPNRVRANSLYRFQPVMIDVTNPPHNVEPNDIVRVMNLFGCPPANTMGHCHVVHLGGDFGGLVCTSSLIPLTPKEKAIVRKNTTRRTPTKTRCGRIPSTRLNLEVL